MNDVLDHIIEIKSMLSELKAKTEATNDKIDDHITWCTLRDEKVSNMADELKEAQGQIREAKATIRTVKWVIPVAGAAIAATLRLLGYKT